jgi:hypothetical protein
MIFPHQSTQNRSLIDETPHSLSMSPPRSSRSKTRSVAANQPATASGGRAEPARDSGTFDFMSKVPSPVVAKSGATTPVHAGPAALPSPATASDPSPIPTTAPAVRKPERPSLEAMPVCDLLCTVPPSLTQSPSSQPPKEVPRKVPASFGNFMDHIPLSQRLVLADPADLHAPAKVCRCILP